jgi:hypothetical protein
MSSDASMPSATVSGFAILDDLAELHAFAREALHRRVEVVDAKAERDVWLRGSLT